MLVNKEDLKIKIVSEEGDKGVFAFDPLPKGFGATLGNSLRRVLLTSTEGAAVTQVKIEGANHQFTTLEGITEDVVDLTLNFKKLRFKLHSENPVIVTIEKKGKGAVTAADIQTSSDVEVMNKKQHIATISNAKTTFKAELVVEPGVGYSPMEERERKNAKIGVIVLDALFSPVERATYEIEPTRFGERTDMDKLVVSVETDGSIAPIDTIKKAAKLLAEYYAVIAGGEITTPEEEESLAAAEPKKGSQMENVSVDELPLQTRTINALKKHGITVLKEIASKSDEELADIKNLGEKSLAEIKELLEKENLR
jgi:DNA-directed RNA polymerase subunit alpha